MGGAVSSLFSAVASAFATFNPITFAISMVASAVLSKLLAPDAPNAGDQPNPGNRQQLPPAGDNKLPVVYGTAYVGGIITDMSISSNNKNIYWVISLCEVTNTDTNSIGSPDLITFGNIYWGGRRVEFDVDGYTVKNLIDESNNKAQKINGDMHIYLYKNGSFNPANSAIDAVTVMSDANLIYQWDNNKAMTNCAFAIVHMKYNADKNLTGLAQTRFQITNARTKPADCIYDYMVSQRYGAAIPVANIDATSLAALNTFSDGTVTYTTYTGTTSTFTRYRFDGSVDTSQRIMNNLQAMSDCCNCLIKYNEITGQWGVIVQTPNAVPVMDINDSNIISSISVTPIDLSNTFNVIEVKFPNGTEKDTFASATFDLAEIDPSLLFPNEPVNKQSVSLYLVNNDVRAQYIANLMLKAAREDLQINLEINYIGLQLEAGDVVTVTNTNYGWAAKQFRITRVTQKFDDTGKVTAELLLSEYNNAVYNDASVTQFTPAPNTGIGDPLAFGTLPVPVITNIYPSIANPAFTINITASNSGIIQYAEIWYSAYQYPTETQLIFAGTTEIQSNGNPYNPSEALPPVTLFNIQAGNWYFFSRMVNAVGKSDFSSASSLLQWRPTTFQFTERYISVAYADDINGGGFNLNPRNKSYFGLLNQDSTTPSTVASAYKWYLAEPTFGTNKYLAYCNRSNRKFSFDTDFADYAGGSGAFVPTTATQFDFRIWSALIDGTNIIDLDKSTGQVIQTGTTSSSSADGQIRVVNTIDGQIIAALDQFLDFGGAQTFTGTATTLTIDKFGRVVGFTAPDDFFFSAQFFTATAGQTVFTPTARAAGYITGQDFIFINGELLSTSSYTETSTTFTLTTGASAGDIVACFSMRCVSRAVFYEPLNITVSSTATNSVVWDSASMPWQLINAGDIITFSNTGTPTQYTVSTVNYTTRTITFTTNPTASAGANIYRYRAANSSYPAFSRWEFDLTDASAYTPTTWAINSGFELPFLNGTIVNEQDYDISTGSINNFPATATGKMVFIQFAMNNLTTPVGYVSNVVAYTVNGVPTYGFTYTSILQIYSNGCLLQPTADYTTSTGSYTFVITPNDSTTVLVQQTFASTGAA